MSGRFGTYFAGSRKPAKYATPGKGCQPMYIGIGTVVLIIIILLIVLMLRRR